MVTQTALQKVIEKIQPGITTTQEIGNIIEEYVHPQGYYVIKEYGGHRIGHIVLPSYMIYSLIIQASPAKKLKKNINNVLIF